jgi:hypothetical protein
MRQLGPAAALTLALATFAPAAAQIPVPLPDPSLPLPGPTGSPALREIQPPSSCTIEGTEGPDRLTGSPGPDVICGAAGDDVLEGLEGDDVLDGGEGFDTATWESSGCCVSADLATGLAGGFLGTDQLVGIESLGGSQGADVLRGDAGPNILTGNSATDLIYGGEGDDWLVGGFGDDWLAGEGGTNVLDGGFGANVCADALGTLCDGQDPGDPSDVRGPLDISLVDGSLSGDVVSFKIAIRGGLRAKRLWDEAYATLSFDTRGGDEMDFHALVGWTKRRPFGLLLAEGSRSPAGRLGVRAAGSTLSFDVPLSRAGRDPLRLYYRWAARTIFTGSGCKPCFDGVPEAGAYPQPLI